MSAVIFFFCIGFPGLVICFLDHTLPRIYDNSPIIPHQFLAPLDQDRTLFSKYILENSWPLSSLVWDHQTMLLPDFSVELLIYPLPSTLLHFKHETTCILKPTYQNGRFQALTFQNHDFSLTWIWTRSFRLQVFVSSFELVLLQVFLTLWLNLVPRAEEIAQW